MKLVLPFVLPSLLLLGFFGTHSMGSVNISFAAFPEPLIILLVGSGLMAIASATRKLMNR